MSLFIESVANQAILVIDASGSVLSDFNGKSVFDKMESIVKTLPEKEFRVCFWNSNNDSNSNFKNGAFKYPYIIKKETIGQIFMHVKTLIKDQCLTFPHLGINAIQEEKEWFTNVVNESNKVYFVTDGQMSTNHRDFVSGACISQSFANSITKLCTNNNIEMHIITVEPKNIDFTATEAVTRAAGSDIYKVITDNKLSKYINKFISYTLNNNEGFVQLNKNTPPPGHIPFGSQYFSETNLGEFITYIRQLITENNNETELLKIVQNLSSTLMYLTKDKPVYLVDQIIKQFCNIFNDTVLDPMFVRFILADSIKNEVNGQATVYAQYRQKLNNLYKEANNMLLNNVNNSINIEDNFITFPIANKMIEGHRSMISEPIIVGSEKFCSGAIKYNNLTLPVLPTASHYSTMNDQCLRQWIRLCVSKVYNVNKLDDSIMYLMMAINLQVQLSEAPIHIKQVFKMFCTKMLQKKRLNSDITELARLENGDLPIPNSGKIEDFYKYMNLVTVNLKLSKDINPMTMWYILCLGMQNENLNKQFIHCKDIKELGLQSDQYTDINIICQTLGIVPIEYYVIDPTTTLDYTCLISLDDTSKSGGYKLAPHVSNYGSVCSPIYVFNDSVLELASNFSCPICYTKINSSSFEKVGPKVVIEQTIYDDKQADIFKPSPSSSSSSSSSSNNASNSSSNYSRSTPIPSNSLSGPKQGCRKIVLIMKGTVGAGKTTISALIKSKVESQGGHCIVVGTDKYCQLGYTTQQAIQKIKTDLLALNKVENDFIVVIVDTCGERSGGDAIFDIKTPGWKKVSIFPNYEKGRTSQYMAWSLRNVLKRVVDTPDCYLKPCGAGVSTCITVHTKKAQALFGNKTCPATYNTSSLASALSSLDTNADEYQEYLDQEMTLESQVNRIFAKF